MPGETDREAPLEAVAGKRVLLVGGGGYVGTRLAHRLLASGCHVTVFDTFWFGDFLGEQADLAKVRGDIRDEAAVRGVVAGQDAMVLMACLSNDPMSDVDPELTRSINYDAQVSTIDLAREAGVSRCVYASSSSVYGTQHVPRVTEVIPLKPITLYSRYKADIEHVLNAAGSDRFTVVSIRSATVCGYSPRMRLDLLAHLFMYLAANKGHIVVDGGNQIRPLIHVSDVVEFYSLLLQLPHERVHREAFNISAGNFTVKAVAELVQKHIPCEIRYAQVIDQRSYPLCSDRAAHELGFLPKRTIDDAIVEVQQAVEDGRIDPTDLRSFNLRYLTHLLETRPELVKRA
jgi:nucleoside-diphosphate-sugar epimerase